MNAGAPTCPSCGGVTAGPQVAQCRFCGQALPSAPAHGAPQAYGAPPTPYGAPQGYGAPTSPYGAPPQGYGAPPSPYGAPPYGGPQPGPYPPVQHFGGPQNFGGYGPGYVDRSWWGSGWSTFFWIRLGIAAFVIGMSLLGACVSALSH